VPVFAKPSDENSVGVAFGLEILADYDTMFSVAEIPGSESAESTEGAKRLL